MSWERSGNGPMKWVPPPPSSSSSNDAGPADPPLGSPTPSYTTLASTASASASAPTTPSSSNSGHAAARHDSSPSASSPWWSSPSPSPPPTHQSGTPRQGAPHPSGLDCPSLLLSLPASPAGSRSLGSAAGRGYDGSPLTQRGYDADRDQDASEHCPSRGRALELLERTVEERGSLAVPPRGRKGKRQCASQLRALSLFDEQYGGAGEEAGEEGSSSNSKAQTEAGGPTIEGEGDSVNDLKSDIDKIRQRGAGMRALDLLNATAAGEKHKPTAAAAAGANVAGAPSHYKLLVGGGGAGGTGDSATASGGMTARRAAQLSYEVRKKEKDEVKAKLRRDRETYGRKPPKVAVPVRGEALAETTRKKKAATDDDVRDPETVSGMKCQLHWDREKEARAKALQLLNDGSASLMAML